MDDSGRFEKFFQLGVLPGAAVGMMAPLMEACVHVSIVNAFIPGIARQPGATTLNLTTMVEKKEERRKTAEHKIVALVSPNAEMVLHILISGLVN